MPERAAIKTSYKVIGRNDVTGPGDVKIAHFPRSPWRCVVASAADMTVKARRQSPARADRFLFLGIKFRTRSWNPCSRMKTTRSFVTHCGFEQWRQASPSLWTDNHSFGKKSRQECRTVLKLGRNIFGLSTHHSNVKKRFKKQGSKNPLQTLLLLFTYIFDLKRPTTKRLSISQNMWMLVYILSCVEKHLT